MRVRDPPQRPVRAANPHGAIRRLRDREQRLFVPDRTDIQSVPSQCKTVPSSPTAQASFAAVPVIARNDAPPKVSTRFQSFPSQCSTYGVGSTR